MLTESSKNEVLQRFDMDVFEYEQDIMKIKQHREELERKRNQLLKDGNTKHYELIQKSAEETYTNVLKIDNKYQTYLEAEDCEILASKLNKFRNECNELLKLKKELIDKIWGEVKSSEEDYIKAINIFFIEFNDVVFKTKTEYTDMRQKAIEFLAKLETGLLEQRTLALKKTKEEVNTLFKQHEKTEASFVELREQEENKNFKELGQVRQEKNKDFFDLKIFLENEIQNHEKCLEDMKAIYQLNAEKLNYNFKVLSEKKEENAILTSVLKKKERFFINLLKRKNDEYKIKDEEYKKINKKLTEQNKNITKQYKELHKKFEYFEVADVERFEQVKEMSLREIADLKQRVHACNRIILEQQLDMEVANVEVFISDNKENDRQQTNQPKPPSNNKEQVAPQPIMTVDNTGNPSSTEFSDLNAESKRELFDFIINETKFLIDDKLLSEIEACKFDDEATVLKIDLIKKVFSLKTELEVDELFRSVHSRCFDDETEQYDVDEFITVITELLDQSKKNMNSKTAKSMLNLRRADVAEIEAATKDNEWESLAKVLDQTTLDIWTGLNKFSSKYYSLLKERKDTIERNRALKKESGELEELLQQYMKKNHRLIFPPVL